MSLFVREDIECFKEFSDKCPNILQGLLEYANLVGDDDVGGIYEEEAEMLLREGNEPFEIILVKQSLMINFEYAGHCFTYWEEVDESELWDWIKEERFDL